VRKVGLAIVALAALAAAGTGSLYAYDASRSDLIAEGVTAAGVPLGGMTPREARAVLERRVVARFETSLKLRWRGATFVSLAELYEIVLDEDGDLHWLAPQRVSPRSAHHLSRGCSGHAGAESAYGPETERHTAASRPEPHVRGAKRDQVHAPRRLPRPARPRAADHRLRPGTSRADDPSLRQQGGHGDLRTPRRRGPRLATPATATRATRYAASRHAPLDDLGGAELGSNHTAIRGRGPKPASCRSGWQAK
jgi:hypothetical protein